MHLRESSSPTVIDSTLIQAVKERVQNAFKTLYESCIRYVYAIVRRYVSNESDHQDVIQEIFARIFLSIDSFDEKKGDFKFWLRRLTINQCIKHYHKHKEQINFDPLESAEQIQSEIIEKTSILSEEEILQFLTDMPNGYKQVFMLVVLDEYSHQEVGKLLNISSETSRSQLLRAKKWIRDNRSKNDLTSLAYGT
jgi:RNA polymerase sigma factor (sigma-70 family)